MAPTSGPEFVVARLTSSGALDTTFGPNGQGYNYTIVTPTTNLTDFVDSLGVDASGNILVGGSWATPAGSFDEQVVRYTPNGLIDTSFANQGVFDLPANRGGVGGIGFQSNGQIILGFWNVTTLGLVTRLNANGTVDTSFGIQRLLLRPSRSGARRNHRATRRQDLDRVLQLRLGRVQRHSGRTVAAGRDS